MFKKKAIVSLITLFLIVTLLLPVQLMAETTPKTMTIVHTNDTHSRIEESSNDGMGFAKVSAKINELRTTLGKENVLVLDAGDTLHGIPLSTVSKGAGIVAILNTIGYDAMTPGNHDFNYGQDRLVELSKTMDFPLISANVKKADTSTLLPPYIIKEVNGIKVGIFGLSTPETTYKTHPKNVQGLDFEDPSKAAAAMVKELENKTDIIIALAHLGLDGGSVYTSEKVALEVPGIDLIIDGHSHTILPEGKKVNDTLIVQTGEYDKNLGIVNVTVNANNEVTFVPTLYTKEAAAALVPDEAVTAVIAKLKAEFDTLTSQKVGSTSVRLVGERENVRSSETNMGNLIVNAMLDATGADVALTNGGGIRASIESGDITKKDIINVLPFGNFIVSIDVTGAELVAALEVGVAKYPAPEGCFPHIGGMSFTFDPSLEAGSRVKEVKIGGKALDKTKTYSLATNDFLAAGGDGYTMFGGKPNTGQFSALDEAVIDYIAVNGVKNIELTGKVEALTTATVPVAETKEPVKAEVKVEVKPEPTPVVVPVSAPAPTVQNTLVKYVVQSGDTLAVIAKKVGTTYQELAKINKLADVHKIYTGSTLLVPAN